MKFSPRHRILSVVFLLVLIAVFSILLSRKHTNIRPAISSSNSAVASKGETPKPVPQPAAPASQQPVQPAPPPPVSGLGAAVHPVTKAAVDAGLLAPVSRLNQVANFLTLGTENKALLFLTPGQTDRDMLSASFETVRPDNSSLYASASFAAGTNGYDAVYDTVEYGTVPCAEVEKKVFSNLTNLGIFKKNITVLDSGTVKVFLMPAGSGCVVIKKEVVH